MIRKAAHLGANRPSAPDLLVCLICDCPIRLILLIFLICLICLFHVIRLVCLICLICLVCLVCLSCLSCRPRPPGRQVTWARADPTQWPATARFHNQAR